MIEYTTSLFNKKVEIMNKAAKWGEMRVLFIFLSQKKVPPLSVLRQYAILSL